MHYSNSFGKNTMKKFLAFVVILCKNDVFLYRWLSRCSITLLIFVAEHLLYAFQRQMSQIANAMSVDFDYAFKQMPVVLSF